MIKLSTIKKSVFLTLFCFAFSSASANQAFSGFYMGASAGANFLTGKENFNYNHVNGVSNLTVAHSNFINKNSIAGLLYLGYGQSLFWDDFYLGGEVYLDFANRKAQTFDSVPALPGLAPFNVNNKIKINPLSYGLDIRPGFTIAESLLLYLRLGFGIYKIELSSIVADRIGALSLNNTFARTVNRTAFRVGFGLEQPLNDFLSIRADYICATLGKTSLSADLRRGVTRVSNQTEVNLVNHSAFLGLCLHW